MAGKLTTDGPDVCFIPRFSFVDGTTYEVSIDGSTAGVLHRRLPTRPATTRVLEIYPTAGLVPRNLLRLYVWFSAPMREGEAGRHIRLRDESGAAMTGALLRTEHELWDPSRRRLTLLLDPARLKRGLRDHVREGYPLRLGETFRVAVDEEFRDAQGGALGAPAERLYAVGPDERRHVEPSLWSIGVPSRGSTEPLDLTLGRPLDHALLARCMEVTGPDGRPIDGDVRIGPEERSWRLTPSEPWGPGDHRLLVDPILEDVAGNSVTRVFDRDLTRPADDGRATHAVALSFRPH
jgi:hypothetical protein